LIYFYGFLIIILICSAILLFYPFSLSIVGSKKFLFIKTDLLLADFYMEKKDNSIKKYIKILGIYRYNLEESEQSFYNPDYNRIYFVISFIIRHLKRIFSFVNIERLGIDLCVGIEDRYMLSQFASFSIMINNYLPDGLYVNFVPDFEKNNFVFYGRGKFSVRLINIFLFIIILFIHPATYAGLWEYYRFRKSE